MKLWSAALSGADIYFLATSKSGLGHLRRVATIARRMKEIAPVRLLHLISNARPEGLSLADLDVFDTVQATDRESMAKAVPTGRKTVVVLDTITVPEVERLDAQLALVLREAPDEQLHRFHLVGSRPWDLAIIANPQEHWMPSAAVLNARTTTAVGWIYRSAGMRRESGGPVPTVLVATGGGGTTETARTLYGELDCLLAKARSAEPPFEVVQAIGPRAVAFGSLAAADRIVDPGPELNELFRESDIVISTAGYNSVLELATTDTPTLLMPIPRSIDDQEARARLWGPKVGRWHNNRAPEQSVKWLAQEIALRRRRPPVDLGPSGEDRAARAILGLG